MFNRYRTQGILLVSQDRGESNKFFTAYTEDFGKIRLFAKSIRKKESKLRSVASLFSLNQIEFIEGKNYRTLTDAKIISDFKEIKKNLTKTAFAHKACEVLNALTKGEQKDEKVWFLLKEFFEDLNQEKLATEFLIYHRFAWKLFFFLGYKPELHNCVFCFEKIKKEPIYFSFENGGIVGSCCAEKEEDIFLITTDNIKVLRILLDKDKKMALKLRIDPQTKKNLETFTEKYLGYLSSF